MVQSSKLHVILVKFDIAEYLQSIKKCIHVFPPFTVFSCISVKVCLHKCLSIHVLFDMQGCE